MPFYAIFLVVAVVSATGIWWVRAGSHRVWARWLLLLLLGWLLGGALGAPVDAGIDVSALPFGTGDRTIVGAHLALVAYVVWAAWRTTPPQDLAALATAFLVGDAIGRVGCILNGCDYGIQLPESLADFGLRYGPGTAAYLRYPSEPGSLRDVTPALWPIAAIEGLVSGGLALVSIKHGLAPALVIWPLVRLALEPLRGDARAFSWGVPNTTLFVAVSAVLGASALSLLHIRARQAQATSLAEE